jgi:hypothetical protein
VTASGGVARQEDTTQRTSIVEANDQNQQRKKGLRPRPDSERPPTIHATRITGNAASLSTGNPTRRYCRVGTGLGCCRKPTRARMEQATGIAVDSPTSASQASLKLPRNPRPAWCERRPKSVARNGAWVATENRGALDLTRERVSKACNGKTAISLTLPRGSRECTRTWNCGVKCVAGCLPVLWSSGS